MQFSCNPNPKYTPVLGMQRNPHCTRLRRSHGDVRGRIKEASTMQLIVCVQQLELLHRGAERARKVFSDLLALRLHVDAVHAVAWGGSCSCRKSC